MLKNNQEIKRLICETLEASTSHGIPNIVRNKILSIKILWLFCFTASTGYCVYNISKSFIDYFSFTSVTKVSYERLNNIEFPTVTICNKNPFFVRKPNMKNSLENNLKNYSKIFFQEILNSSESTLESFLKFSYLNSYETLKYKPFLSLVSFNIDVMLINCRFNNSKCTKNDFEENFVSGIGNCYKFNSGKNAAKNNSKILRTTIPGQKNGLMLELFTGYLSEEYDPIRTGGIQIFIHNSSNIPFVEFDSISLSTGRETDIWLSQQQISKLASPYSNCVDDVFSFDSYDSYLYRKCIRLFNRYQQKTCLLLCFHEYVRQECGCYSSDAFNTSINQACNFSLNSCVFDAYARFHQTDQSTKCSDYCPIECHSVNYNFKTFQADFPSPFYGKVLIEDNKLKPNLARNLTSFQNVKDTVLAVNVFYDDLSLNVIKEYPAKTIEQLVAEIGGFLGLCVGISLLSIVEIFEIILKIFFSQCKSKINVDNEKNKIFPFQ